MLHDQIHLISLGSAAALVLLSGCPGAQTNAPSPARTAAPQPAPPESSSEPELEPPAVDIGVIARAGQPLLLPTAGTPAPWLEPPIAGEPRQATFTAETIASGARAAVVVTDARQYVGYHADVGAVGVLRVPADTIWLGFGARDVLFAADRSGRLYAADTLDAARSAAGWKPRGIAPAATMWDAAPGVVAASNGTLVWVSTDEGQVFQRSEPVRTKEAKAKIDKLFVRSGPTVVLTVPGGERVRVWISNDGGKRFNRSLLRPRKLARTGPWIWTQTWDCPALLSEDGRTWVEPTSKQVHQAHNTWSWAAALQTTTGLDGIHHVPDWATPTYPPVPDVSRSARRIRGANPCPPPKKGLGGGFGVGGTLEGIGMGTQCKGISCLRSDAASEPPDTRTGFFLLRDAKCAPAKDPFKCPNDKRPLRLPHAAFVDQVDGTIQIASLPDSCLPVRVWSVRGLGILLCREGAHTEIWVSDGAPSWHREHTLRAAPETVWNASSAADGTVLLQRSCPRAAESCSATVRRPVAVTSQEAWFDITEQGALTHRPVVGGRVLAVVERAGAAFLSLAASDEEHVVLATSLAIAGDAFKLDVEASGKVRIDSRDGDNGKRSVYIGADGATHPTDVPEPRRGPDGVIVVEPTPFDPSHMPKK